MLRLEHKEQGGWAECMRGGNEEGQEIWQEEGIKERVHHGKNEGHAWLRRRNYV